MSYYDDLGVQTNASPESIRESYHALARLLHPDAQQDDALRVAAEAQMRRINQGYAVLRDAAKRRRYDSELMLTTGRSAPIVMRPLRPIRKSGIPFGALAWAAAAIACCGVIYWLSSQGGQSGVGHAPAGIQDDLPYPAQMQPTLANPAPVTPQRGISSREDRETILFLRRELQIVRAQRDAALAGQRIAGASRTRIEQPSPAEAFPVVAIPPPEENSGDVAPLAGKLTEPAPFRNSDFAGFWIYPKPKNASKDPKLFPPDYIEAAIVEHDGTIRGKYRARYNMSDRGSSPNVNFDFEGKVTGPLLSLPWKDEGGAKGEVELKLLSKTQLEVNWKATKPGHALALINGTAVLMRRPD